MKVKTFRGFWMEDPCSGNKTPTLSFWAAEGGCRTIRLTDIADVKVGKG